MSAVESEAQVDLPGLPKKAADPELAAIRRIEAILGPLSILGQKRVMTMVVSRVNERIEQSGRAVELHT